MKSPIRIVAGTIAGFSVWAVLWFAGTAAVQATFSDLSEGQPITNSGYLWLYIVLSATLSLLAGSVTALIARSSRVIAVWLFALIQQAFGVVAEMSYWNLMPVWYHLVFLSLIIPMTILGGWMAATIKHKSNRQNGNSKVAFHLDTV